MRSDENMAEWDQQLSESRILRHLPGGSIHKAVPGAFYNLMKVCAACCCCRCRAECAPPLAYHLHPLDSHKSSTITNHLLAHYALHTHR